MRVQLWRELQPYIFMRQIIERNCWCVFVQTTITKILRAHTSLYLCIVYIVCLMLMMSQTSANEDTYMYGISIEWRRQRRLHRTSTKKKHINLTVEMRKCTWIIMVCPSSLAYGRAARWCLFSIVYRMSCCRSVFICASAAATAASRRVNDARLSWDPCECE